MTIKTKHKIGDEVWFNFKGKAKKMKVTDILINLSSNIEIELTAKCIIIYTHPSRVFHTKEELLNSL
jgi:hypothetical protein